jgi:hypothetical protein
MNIFVLSECPVESAEMMCDKHIPKMIVEAAQMLSTAHRMVDGSMEKRPSKSGKRMVNYYVHPNSNLESALYKAVHHYHPCTVWTMESKANYTWHYTHFLALCSEFKHRFNKPHLTEEKLSEVLSVPPANILDIERTPFALAMAQFPACIVKDNPVQSYRNYYHTAKSFAKWEKSRPAPSWWEGYKGPEFFMEQAA